MSRMLYRLEAPKGCQSYSLDAEEFHDWVRAHPAPSDRISTSFEGRRDQLTEFAKEKYPHIGTIKDWSLDEE